MRKVTTKDRTQIHDADWGTGPPVVFSHGWPLSAQAWDDHMLFLADRGYRCIAHDRGGHGRSGQPWFGHDMDTYADDLATLVDTLDLKQAVLVGHMLRAAVRWPASSAATAPAASRRPCSSAP